MTRLLSILIPVYNNAASLPELCSRIVATLAPLPLQFEVVLVNDGSADDSWKVLRTLAQADTRIRALCLSRNFGQHAAIAAALEHASGTDYVLMDADLQDRPELIPQMLELLDRGGHDIVYTLKRGGDDSLLKRLSSRAFHALVSRSTASRHARSLGTYRLFTRKVADALRHYGERAVVYGPLMHTMGFDAGFLPVQRDPRAHGGSSYSLARRVALAFQSIVSYSTLPQRLFLWIGGLLSSASMAYLLVIVVQRLAGVQGLPQGLTLVVVVVLFSTGVLMAGIGVLAAYLFVIYREVLARPRYHVQEMLNMEHRHER